MIQFTTICLGIREGLQSIKLFLCSLFTLTHHETTQRNNFYDGVIVNVQSTTSFMMLHDGIENDFFDWLARYCPLLILTDKVHVLYAHHPQDTEDYTLYSCVKSVISKAVLLNLGVPFSSYSKPQLQTWPLKRWGRLIPWKRWWTTSSNPIHGASIWHLYHCQPPLFWKGNRRNCWFTGIYSKVQMSFVGWIYITLFTTGSSHLSQWWTQMQYCWCSMFGRSFVATVLCSFWLASSISPPLLPTPGDRKT